MAVANATLVSKHPSTIMIEQPATNNRKLEMEAKHDLELGRIKNERELQVNNNDQKHKHKRPKRYIRLYILLFHFQHCDYAKQQANEKNEDLERRNRELEQIIFSMEHQKITGEHTKEVRQAEIDRLKDANDREEREAARDQEDLKKHQDNMKEILKLDHERKMEKERLKHQWKTEKLSGK